MGTQRVLRRLARRGTTRGRDRDRPCVLRVMRARDHRLDLLCDRRTLRDCRAVVCGAQPPERRAVRSTESMRRGAQKGRAWRPRSRAPSLVRHHPRRARCLARPSRRRAIIPACPAVPAKCCDTAVGDRFAAVLFLPLMLILLGPVHLTIQRVPRRLCPAERVPRRLCPAERVPRRLCPAERVPRR
jgi:hypothetical protein